MTSTFSVNGFKLVKEADNKDENIYYYKVGEEKNTLEKAFWLEINKIKNTVTLNLNNDSIISSEKLIEMFYTAFRKREFIVSEEIGLSLLVIKTKETGLDQFLIEKGFFKNFSKNPKEHVWVLDTKPKVGKS